GGSTNIGADNDATSLENFKRALSMVRYGNALRTSDTNFTNLEDLKVNPTLFAISQVQINATANRKKPGHSHLYNVGENIMGSPISEDDKGLYEGWYDSEKQVYDYITAKGWTIVDVNNDEAKYNEVMEAVGHSNIQVGHYLALVNPDYTVSGVGYIYSKTPAPDGYRCNAGQVFDNPKYSSNITDANTMTIDEFEAQFNEYYNKLMNADSILKDGETKLEALKAELENQRQVLGTKTAAQTNAQTNVATVQTQVTQATNATTRAEANVATKQAAFDKLCNDDTALNMAKEIVGLKTQKTQLETVDRGNAQKALENAQQEKKDADKNVENKKGIVNDAQATLKKRKDILDEANKGIETAKANLDVAEKDVDAKSKALGEAKNNEKTKKALYEASQKTLETAKANQASKEKELETAKAEEAKKASVAQAAKTDFETATLKQKSLKDLKAEIASTQEQIGAHQKAIKDFNGAIAKLDETIGQLENEQASIEDVKGQVEKAYEAYKKLCADPTGFMDVVDSDNDVVLGLYSKMGSMRTAYEEYATALNVFLGVEEQWNVNKAELDVALKAYKEADKDLASAQLSLKLYLVSQKGKGWQKVESKWYYVDSTGRTVTNQWIKNYYFEADGTMATSKWIGNYYVDANGRYTPDQWVLTNG
ncbi:CAP domain-containing protein, partial [uncultured Holdemanella sp.]|uniref:CAP domain-containing protein n=1 Tax=uncultured Holdemanella sp. TaxID=1763549 RepID=UPI002804636D